MRIDEIENNLRIAFTGLSPELGREILTRANLTEKQTSRLNLYLQGETIASIAREEQVSRTVAQNAIGDAVAKLVLARKGYDEYGGGKIKPE